MNLSIKARLIIVNIIAFIGIWMKWSTAYKSMRVI